MPKSHSIGDRARRRPKTGGAIGSDGDASGFHGRDGRGWTFASHISRRRRRKPRTIPDIEDFDALPALALRITYDEGMAFRTRTSIPTDPRTWLVLLVLMSPVFYDCARQQSQTGIYVPQCSGVVVSARPTLKSWYDWFESDRSDWRMRSENSRWEGHYVAVIRRDDNHRRQKVAIPETVYRQPLTGKHLRCSGQGVEITAAP